jgi:threonine aldolase
MYEHMTRTDANAKLPQIDLRSDTVTKPTPAMREAMKNAEVGDDVYGDDPTVNALEQKGAELLGKEAALFLPSSTMSNLIAMYAQSARGDEIILGQDYHIYAHEAGGTSIVGGTFPCPLPVGEDGGLDPKDIENAIKPNDSHYPISRILSLENTVSGQAVPLKRLDACLDVADKFELRKHLDGARLFNAAIKLGLDAATIAERFHTVNICLSKGLGTPVGALLIGDKETIARARRARKFLGGGMRQAGILAAAGIHALDHHIERMADDHARAKKLASALSKIERIKTTHQDNQTNMVFIDVAPEDAEKLQAHMAQNGIIMAGGTQIRLVTHLDIDDEALERVISAFQSYFGKE